MTEEKDLLDAILLVKAGNKNEAIPILKSIIKLDRNNERAWLWLSFCVDKPEDKIFCYQQVLRINPNNEHTRIALTQLEPNPSPQPNSREVIPQPEKIIEPKPIKNNKGLQFSILFLLILIVVILSIMGMQSASHYLSTPSDYAIHITETYNAPYIPVIPTARPTRNPNIIRAGTYIVGKDIQPGTYKGQAGSDVMHSCYWARLSNLSGEDDILANDNSMGQYYVEVVKGDYAFKTDCELIRVGN
jgi:tetratricopeptide (TPR) repeat protein